MERASNGLGSLDWDRGEYVTELGVADGGGAVDRIKKSAAVMCFTGRFKERCYRITFRTFSWARTHSLTHFCTHKR